MEWRETYNSAMREISIMARSFSLKRENGRFDDLQEKNTSLHHGRIFSTLSDLWKMRKMNIFISSVPTF